MIQSEYEANIVAVMQAWAAAFSADSTDDIMTLYAPDASLWGTMSSVRRDNHVSIRDYFEGLFVWSGRKVDFTETHIRFYGDIAISAGTYLLAWRVGKEVVEVPARYSLVYRQLAGKWLIVDHHSSQFPKEI